jgi:hypothetical protein
MARASWPLLSIQRSLSISRSELAAATTRGLDRVKSPTFFKLRRLGARPSKTLAA